MLTKCSQHVYLMRNSHFRILFTIISSFSSDYSSRFYIERVQMYYSLINAVYILYIYYIYILCFKRLLKHSTLDLHLLERSEPKQNTQIWHILNIISDESISTNPKLPSPETSPVRKTFPVLKSVTFAFPSAPALASMSPFALHRTQLT